MKKICLAILLMSSACTKDDTSNPQPEAIVQAYLLPHREVSVRIIHEIPSGAERDSLRPLEGLSPVLVQNHTTHPLTYLGNGLYGNPNIQLQEKDSCHLYFQFNGKEVSAHTVIPDKPTGFTCNADTLKYVQGKDFPEVLEFKWDNPGRDYHVILIEYAGARPWWVRPAYPGMIWIIPFLTPPTKESIAWVPSSEARTTRGESQMILYRILPEYAVVLNEKDVFSQNLRNPPNNIINGYGIFTGVSSSDTLTLHEAL